MIAISVLFIYFLFVLIIRVQSKPIIETTKKGLSATNPAIRTASVTLAGTLFLFMGPPLRTYFEGEKPALLQQINTEFDKVMSNVAYQLLIFRLTWFYNVCFFSSSFKKNYSLLEFISKTFEVHKFLRV